MEAGVASSLVKAGLGREAAIAGITDLTTMADRIGVDVLARMDEAFGSSRVALHASFRHGTGRITALPDVDALLRDGAAEGLVDSLRGVRELLDASAERAAIAGDVRVEQLLRAGSRDAEGAAFAVRTALDSTSDPASRIQWVEAADPSTMPSVFRSRGNERYVDAKTLRELVTDATERARAATLLVDDAPARLGDFDAISTRAAAARADADARIASGDLPGGVAQLAQVADDLLAHARRIRAEDIPAAFRSADEAIRVDVAAVDRVHAGARMATSEAASLVARAEEVLAGSGPELAELGRLAETARPQVAAFEAQVARFNRFTDTLVRGGSPHARIEANERALQAGRIRLADDTTREFRYPSATNDLFSGGTFRRSRLRESVAADVPAAIRTAMGHDDPSAVEAVGKLAQRAQELSNGSHELAGSSALALAREAIARGDARFGSAEDLRAAIDAVRAQAPGALA